MASFKPVFRNSTRWQWSIILILTALVTTRCSGNMPPIPATPSGPTLQIAVLTPTSGELATFGRLMRNGIIMAFDHWNNEGGVLGRRLEWQLYHTDCTFEATRQATQQAIDNGLRFIIGPLCSEAAIAAAELAEMNQALMIAPAATHPLVTVNGHNRTRPTVFRAGYSYNLQGRAAARFASHWLGVTRAAVLLNPTDDYSTALAGIFAQEFTAQGGTITQQATYAQENTDFLPLLANIQQTGAQLIYLPAGPEVANQLAGQMSQHNINLLLLGSDAWHADNLNKTAAEGSYFPLHFTPNNEQPFTQRWAEDYKSAYATEPTALAALSFDATQLLLQAIQQTGRPDPAQVAKTLEQQQMLGVTGQISFDNQHNPLKPVYFVQIKKGHTTLTTSVNLD